MFENICEEKNINNKKENKITKTVKNKSQINNMKQKKEMRNNRLTE